MCSLILMMSLTIPPLRCSLYFFLSHLSSLIVLHFVFCSISSYSLFCIFPFFAWSISSMLTSWVFLLLLYLLLSLCWLNELCCERFGEDCICVALWLYFLLSVLLHSLLIILWYSIIILYCKYSLAGHIPFSISTPAVDADIGTCSNYLSALLCILSISSISLVIILPHAASPCSIAGISHNSL